MNISHVEKQLVLFSVLSNLQLLSKFPYVGYGLHNLSVFFKKMGKHSDNKNEVYYADATN